MVVRSKGTRSKSRHKLSKKSSETGVTVSRLMQKFEKGEKVYLNLEPAVHKGMPHPKWQGKSGVIAGKRGRAYVVEIQDREMKKTIITFPVHLNPAK